MTQAPLPPLHQRFTVSYAYPVHFTRHLLDPDNPLLASLVEGIDGPAKVLAVVDQGLVRAREGLLADLKTYAAGHGDRLVLAGEPLLVPGGEGCKTDPTLVEALQEAVSDRGICRHSYVMALGGGAVLDLVGYTAATAHRGVRLVRVPTTVLSQNDSGVGVKNGVNAFGKKNFLGTFAPPAAVVNDLEMLTTLEDRDWRAGLAEAVKVALIRDGAFFAELEDLAPALVARELTAMGRAVHRCAALHMAHIAGGDPFELGSARPLDFGHWAAHRLERLTDYRLRHGEAVAIGMALDCHYAQLAGLLADKDLERILGLLTALGFDLFTPELLAPTLFDGLEEFREHLGGRLTLTLLEGIGRGVEVHRVDRARYRQALERLAGGTVAR